MALKQETVDYITLLAQTYGLDKDAMLKKAEADEKALKAVEDVVPRSTFSREMDKQRAGLNEEINKAKSEYYNSEVLPKWNEQQKLLQQLQQEKARLEVEAMTYRNTYGTLEGFQPSAAAGGTGTGNAPANGAGTQPTYMKPDEVAGFVGNFWKQVTPITFQHFKEFGEPLDVDKFEKFAVDGKYGNFRQAWEDFVKPQRDAKAAVDLEKKLADAKKAGVDEYLAAHPNLPIDNSAPGSRGSMLFRQPSAEDQAAKVLNDPNAPNWAKEATLREQFVRDLGSVTARGLITGK